MSVWGSPIPEEWKIQNQQKFEDMEKKIRIVHIQVEEENRRIENDDISTLKERIESLRKIMEFMQEQLEVAEDEKIMRGALAKLQEGKRQARVRIEAEYEKEVEELGVEYRKTAGNRLP